MKQAQMKVGIVSYLMAHIKTPQMKKLLILLALSASMVACSSNTKTEVAEDTTETGENTSAAAQQSSVDTNVNKIGTDPAVKDTTKKDSL